jgi:hypothetical protein
MAEIDSLPPWMIAELEKEKQRKAEREQPRIYIEDEIEDYENEEDYKPTATVIYL